jgi:hypothetical protein
MSMKLIDTRIYSSEINGETGRMDPPSRAHVGKTAEEYEMYPNIPSETVSSPESETESVELK